MGPTNPMDNGDRTRAESPNRRRPRQVGVSPSVGLYSASTSASRHQLQSGLLQGSLTQGAPSSKAAPALRLGPEVSLLYSAPQIRPSKLAYSASASTSARPQQPTPVTVSRPTPASASSTDSSVGTDPRVGLPRRDHQ